MERRRFATTLIAALMAPRPARADDVGDLLDGVFSAGLQALFDRTRVVNPRLEAPFGVSLVSPGLSAELRRDMGSFDQARRVEEAFQRVLNVSADEAMSYALEDQALQLLIETGLKTALAQAGIVEVLTADELRQWTEQRRNERTNDEVRQPSLPEKGTLERPFLIVRWRWVAVAGVDFERWWQLVTDSRIVELTSQLSVSIQLADTGQTVAVYTVPVEVRAAGSRRASSRQQYGRPFVHAMMNKACAHLGTMLAAEAVAWEQVRIGRRRLALGLPSVSPEGGAVTALPKLVEASGLPRYRVFAVRQPYAILTAGAEDGLVGATDVATGQPTRVTIGPHALSVMRAAPRWSLIRLDGQPVLADQSVSWPGMPLPAASSSAASAATAPAPADTDSDVGVVSY